MSKTPRTPSGYEIAANLAEEVDQLRAELTAAKEKIAEQEATIKALRGDAERYRLLRTKVADDYGSCFFTFRWQCATSGGGTVEKTLEIPRAALDAAIDAALKK